MAGKPWYNNGKEEIQRGENEEIPDGFVKGRLPPSEVSRQKARLTNINKSKEQKDAENKKRSDSLKSTFANMSDERKSEIIQKRKDAWDNKTEQEKADYRAKLSQSSIGKNKGATPWNKGLTKETDDRVAQIAQKTSDTNIAKSLEIKNSNPDYYKNWRTSINDVMRGNNSFNRSNEEDAYYNTLVDKYGTDNVVRWYSDDRYPFVCDFYIPSEDLFIELNRHWTHGGHPFDPMSLEDISKLEMWEEMSKTSKYYKNAIYTWTILDVKKSKVAKENNLNYKVIY